MGYRRPFGRIDFAFAVAAASLILCTASAEHRASIIDRSSTRWQRLVAYRASVSSLPSPSIRPPAGCGSCGGGGGDDGG